MSDIWLGHIPAAYLIDQPEGLDVLVTRWPDGSQEVAVRPGHQQTQVRWSPPAELVAERAS